MATLYTNSAEGGTSGNTVTAGTSGGASGSQFGSVAKGASSTVQFSNAHPAHGSLGYYLNHASGDASYFQLPTSADTSPTYAARQYLYFTANPGANDQFVMQFRNASTSAVTISISTAGKFKVMDTLAATKFTGTITVSTSTQIRVECLVTKGTGTTDGTINFAWYLGDSGTAQETYSVTNVNTGTTDMSAVRFGRGGAIASVWDYYLDDIALQTGATGLIGPVANIAPTATITANQNVAASASGTATVTPADSDGTIASQVWSVVSGSSTATLGTLTNTTTTTVGWPTAPAAGNLVTLQCLVTDNGGATVTPTTEVRVPVTGATTAVPLAFNGTNVVGTMTNTGGASSDGAALADASDVTYIESGTVSAVEQSERYRWQPSNSRSAAALVIRLGTDTSTANAIVRLYEGSTLRETFATQAITSTATDYTFTLAGATISAITDWGNLYFEVGFTS